MTQVVNVKVSSIRPTYQNLEEWCNNPENVYIGRAGIVFVDGVRYPRVASPWANPYKLSSSLTREDALEKYKTHIKAKFGESLHSELEKLRGKRLGCWCKPEACHGDILIEFLNSKNHT